MGKKHRSNWSIQDFQEEMEDRVRKGALPQPVKTAWAAKLIYKAYREVENKQAKLALLIQLSEVLVALRLRNPTKRFDKIISEIEIEKAFAYELLTAYTNPTENWELPNG